MENSELLLKLVEIERRSFDFYGNDCRYYLEMYTPGKIRIGDGAANIVQMGVDFSSAYEFLYDYDMANESERQELAEILGVDKIEEEWVDEGTVDPDRLPTAVCEMIEERECEALVDYYYEEFAEWSDEDGFMRMTDFVDHYMFRDLGRDKTLDMSQPMEEMFDDIGWFNDDIDESALPPRIDITSPNEERFVKVAAIVDEELENLDMISACVNIRYDSDYDYEDEAAERMLGIFDTIAYVIVMALLPKMDFTDSASWKQRVEEVIHNIGVMLEFVYSDESLSQFERPAERIYKYLSNPSVEPMLDKGAVEATRERIAQSIDRGIFPMNDVKFARLLERIGL